MFCSAEVASLTSHSVIHINAIHERPKLVIAGEQVDMNEQSEPFYWTLRCAVIDGSERGRWRRRRQAGECAVRRKRT